MGKPSAPTPPDPKKVAGAQTAQNIGTAIAQQNLNNVNQITPDGTLTYNQTGSYTYTDPNTGQKHEIPRYTATQTLSAAQQAIHDQKNNAKLNFAKLAADQSGRLNSILSSPMDTNNLPQRGNVDDIRRVNLKRASDGTDFSEDRKRVEDALMERMNPRLEQDRQRLETRLASQGIRLGSAAYNAAMDDLNRSTNDARLGAVLQAGQEQSRLAGLKNQAISMDNQASVQETNADSARFDAMNNMRNQALKETFAIRNQPINEITALMSGSQVRNPSFITPKTAQIANTDVAGIHNAHTNALNQQYAQKVAMRGQNLALAGSLFSGGANMGAAAMMASDRRVKENIKEVGKTNDGQPIYTFNYKGQGGIQLGLMAQDVEKKKPEAVIQGPGGIKMVNYDLALKGAVK